MRPIVGGLDRRRWIFPALLAALAIAYLWRITGFAPFEPVTDHLSNFYLTGTAVTLLSGPAAFVDPARRRRGRLAAGVLAGANLVAEVGLRLAGIDDDVNQAMGDVNTSDPVDGLFGLMAAALVASLLARPSRD